MPSSRAADLRAALQDALGADVEMFPARTGERISAVAPAPGDWERWRKAIDILRTADAWGSSDTGEAPKIWAEVNDEVSP